MLPTSFSPAHAFFRSCPDIKNGKSCNNAIYLQSKVGRRVTFDTRLGFRDGGSCGVIQNVVLITFYRIDEHGRRTALFNCDSFLPYCRAYFECSSNQNCDTWIWNRFNITYFRALVPQTTDGYFHYRDKYDFMLVLDNLSPSDAGKYEYVVDLRDAAGNRATSISRMFQLKVTTLQPHRYY